MRVTWDIAIDQFEDYLRLERSLSLNTVWGYRSDLEGVRHFIARTFPEVTPQSVTPQHLQAYLAHLHAEGLSATTQARMLSALRGMYRFLALSDGDLANPVTLLHTPRTARPLPHTLEVHEVEQLLEAVDLASLQGVRNRAILEVMYSTGMRVSEAISLKLSHLDPQERLVRVVGKGQKERMVPIGRTALYHLYRYIDEVRSQGTIQPGCANHVFLGRRGKPLSRQMIFVIIKALAQKIGLSKTIGPHTLRHSCATHLIDAGADLRAVQMILGHASIATTEIYTHLDRHYLHQVIHDCHPRGC